MLAANLRLPVTQEAFGPRVPANYTSLGIQHEYRIISRALYQQPEALLAPAQAFPDFSGLPGARVGPPPRGAHRFYQQADERPFQHEYHQTQTLPKTVEPERILREEEKVVTGQGGEDSGQQPRPKATSVSSDHHGGEEHHERARIRLYPKPGNQYDLQQQRQPGSQHGDAVAQQGRARYVQHATTSFGLARKVRMFLLRGSHTGTPI